MRVLVTAVPLLYGAEEIETGGVTIGAPELAGVTVMVTSGAVTVTVTGATQPLPEAPGPPDPPEPAFAVLEGT